MRRMDDVVLPARRQAWAGQGAQAPADEPGLGDPLAGEGDTEPLRGGFERIGAVAELAALAASRASGTSTTPTFGSIVQKG